MLCRRVQRRQNGFLCDGSGYRSMTRRGGKGTGRAGGNIGRTGLTGRTGRILRVGTLVKRDMSPPLQLQQVRRFFS